MDDQIVIKAENVYKSFKGQQILKDFSLSVKKGEILALIGQSGKGKSVFLKHIVGLLKPDKGSVFVHGKDISKLNRDELNLMRRKFAYVFQNGALLDSMTLFDNVALPLREVLKMKEKAVKDKVLAELFEVGLGDATNKYPAELSGGMLRRAALARALVMDPEVILFDEPTTGLDPIISSAILNHIRDIHKRVKFTGVLITHQIPRAFSVVQKVAMIYDGKIIEEDTPINILKCENPLVCQFIHGDVSGPIKENYF